MAAKGGRLTLDEIAQAVHDRRLFVTPTGEVVPIAPEDGAALPPLQNASQKVAAYRAHGCEIIDVPEPLRTRAKQLANILDVVGDGPGAPREMVELAERLVHAWALGSATGAEPWMFVLEQIMRMHCRPHDDRSDGGSRDGPGIFGDDPVLAAGHMVGMLRQSTVDVPKAFVEATSEQLEKAGKVFLATRVKLEGEVSGRGGHVSPWTAATRFAEVFGVTMPRRADALRERKSPRKRSR